MFTSLELYYTETTKPIYRGYLTTRQAARIEAHKCVQLAQSRHAPTGNRTREFFVASPMPNQWRHYEMQLQIDRVITSVHWSRARFKVACLVRQSLSGQASLYLADDCRLVSDSSRPPLRSADFSTCVVPRTLSSYGNRTFAAAGPRLWNSFPVQLRNPDIIADCSGDS